MAVGETSGQGDRPRRVVSAGGGRRRPELGEPGSVTGDLPIDDSGDIDVKSEPIIPEVDPELERLIAEEEEIERRTREHHEAPHFREGD